MDWIKMEVNNTITRQPRQGRQVVELVLYRETSEHTCLTCLPCLVNLKIKEKPNK
jgi:hypothetical protein